MRKPLKSLAREKKRKIRGFSAKDLEKLKRTLPDRKPHRIYSAEDTAALKAKFLTALARTGNISQSAKLAGVSRALIHKTWRCEGTLREWSEDELKEADEFKALMDEALEEATDLLEQEARRRGMLGYDKPIVFKGKIVGTYKEYSDRMLEILLKAHRRKKFGDKTEITGAEGGPVSVIRKVERVIVDPKQEKSK